MKEATKEGAKEYRWEKKGKGEGRVERMKEVNEKGRDANEKGR